MKAFFVGLVIAVILAVGSSIGLNAWDLSAKHVFSTEETRL